MRFISLRQLSDNEVKNNTELLDLPIVFSGTFGQCQTYAHDNGYVWRVFVDLMYGGYWANCNGDCLLPT